ncbi:MAG: hypothetical protein DRR08_26905 [Candidatus Parabeggiatoa sp. nov. 2]|nr:MAG: hypothetical protein B6247_17355 [Beggiatoa sp. 4572_84]RKZ53947.1 MAG: hypothetical protein DRR08_26905 [Gammaproteobacteria bacterium]
MIFDNFCKDYPIERPQCLQVEKVFISYKERLRSKGFDLFKYLFLSVGTEIVVIFGQGNEKLDDQELMNEIISLIHCFSMKHYSFAAYSACCCSGGAR